MPEEVSTTKTDNRNYIRVNNHFNFTNNFGDSLSLIALVAGVFFIIKISSKSPKKNRKKNALILP